MAPTSSPWPAVSANDLGIGAKLEAIKHEPAGLSHRGLGFQDGFVQLIQGCFDQERVVNRCTHPNATLDCEAASEPEHLCSVCLHGEVSQSSWIDVLSNVESPTEHRPELPMQHRMVHGCI